MRRNKILILGRFIGQRIIVNDDLIITIHEVTDKAEGMEVELSFHGPKEKYLIDREEVHNRRKKGLKHD